MFRARGSTISLMSLGRLVPDVAQQRGLLGLDKAGELFDQIGLADLIGDLVDHHAPGPAAGVLLFPSCPAADAATTGLVGLPHRGRAFDDHAAGGKIRALDVFEQVGGDCGRPLQQQQAGVDQLAGVVRRDAGRHTDGDAGGAIGQQVGEAGGEHDRLLFLAVVGLAQVDRVLVDAVEQKLRHIGEAALGVAHGGGVIAVDIAEVALAVDEAITLGEVLGEANQGVVDRDIAVRVILADHVADDPRRLLGGGVRIEPQQPHGIEHPAMDRLQSVPHIRQGALGDRRERIGEIAPRQRLAEVLVDDPATVFAWGDDAFVHGGV